MPSGRQVSCHLGRVRSCAPAPGPGSASSPDPPADLGIWARRNLRRPLDFAGGSRSHTGPLARCRPVVGTHGEDQHPMHPPFTPWRPGPVVVSRSWSEKVCRRSALSCRFIGSDAHADPCPPSTRTQVLEDLLLISGPEPPVLLVEARARPPGTQRTARTDVQIRPGSGCSPCGAITTTKGGPCDTTATFHVATSPPVPGDATGVRCRAPTWFTGYPSSPRTHDGIGGRFGPGGAGDLRRTWRHPRRPSFSVRFRPSHPYLEDEDDHPVAVP